MQIQIYNGELTCPKCGAPADKIIGVEGKFLIRAFKVSDEEGQWSQCLVCSGNVVKELDDEFKFVYRNTGLPLGKTGWFCTRI